MSVLRITAKPIVWVQDGDDYWHEPQYGFSINFDSKPPIEYTAHFGEGDEESFDTLDEAKEWCQEMINSWVDDVAVVTITND